MSDLAAALQIAIRVHAAQTDRQGEPYLLHVLRVVEAVKPYDAKVVAALHDVVEDGDMTLTEVCSTVGCDDDERQALKAITRWGDEYGVYIDRMARWGGASGSIAREVKLADLKDHVDTMPPEPSITGAAGTLQRRATGYEHKQWCAKWLSLRRRYERAIEILEAAG